LLDS
jgi:hypothetical protein